MVNVSLLEFFRNGTFHGIKLRDTREKIESILGLPNVHHSGHKGHLPVREEALWYYAGVQFTFDNDPLSPVQDIGFRLGYVHPESTYRNLETERISLDTWVFGKDSGPFISELKQELINEHIDFQNTGLESIFFNETIENFEVIAYDSSAEESFGTLVLKSGIQVRYSADGEILRVQIGGGSWSYKGKEQYIIWE